MVWLFVLSLVIGVVLVGIVFADLLDFFEAPALFLGFVSVAVGVFGLLAVGLNASDRSDCKDLAIVANVETRYDKWGPCYVKQDDGKWYTESTWRELKEKN